MVTAVRLQAECLSLPREQVVLSLTCVNNAPESLRVLSSLLGLPGEGGEERGVRSICVKAIWMLLDVLRSVQFQSSINQLCRPDCFGGLFRTQQIFYMSVSPETGIPLLFSSEGPRTKGVLRCGRL